MRRRFFLLPGMSTPARLHPRHLLSHTDVHTIRSHTQIRALSARINLPPLCAFHTRHML